MKLLSFQFHFCLALPLLIGGGTVAPVQAQAIDMFPTKAAAEKRAKQLNCSGAFAMGKEGMPCKDFPTYEKAISKAS